MDLQKLSAKQRANYHYMADAMRRLEWDLHNAIEATSRIPEEWHEIARATAAPPKTRVTMRMDADVLRFFKSMGAGHLPRMNEVLRSYMHARLAGVIRGAETVDFYKAQREAHADARPMWGDTGRALDGAPAASAAEVAAERKAQLRERMKAKRVEG